MQTTRPVQIDVRRTIASLALLLVGAALLDREPGEAVEVLCDEPSFADDLNRFFHDWICERVWAAGKEGDTGCVLTLRKTTPT
jgi:TusA-related sulfurtransferase